MTVASSRACRRPPGETATEHSAAKNLPLLMLGALGVVYGDIGTSPIYAFREALHASSGGELASREQMCSASCR